MATKKKKPAGKAPPNKKPAAKGKGSKEKTAPPSRAHLGQKIDPIHLYHFLHMVGVNTRSEELAAVAGLSTTTMYKAVCYGYRPTRKAVEGWDEKLVAWIKGDKKLKTALDRYLKEEGLESVDDLFTKPKRTVNKNRLELIRAGLKDDRPALENIQIDWSVEPMLNQTMRHFRLAHNPFVGDVTQEDDVFLTRDWKETFENLKYVAENGGFQALIGESGSGKSIMREMLEAQLRDEGLVQVTRPATLDQGKITTYSLMDAILADLGVNPGTVSEEKKVRQVKDLLIKRHEAHKRTVLVIEDAQRLNNKTLYFLKGLVELKHNFRPLLGIILIAQPELLLTLDEATNFDLRQTIRRIEVLTMPPLNGSTAKYLEFKFERVGASLAKIMTPEAVAAISEYWTRYENTGRRKIKISQCYPLTINNTVIKAMNFCAKTSGSKIVKADDVVAALRPRRVS